MTRTLISTAYVYPICPLSFNHARMFVIADIVARHFRSSGAHVFFPVASHYSGNTAQRVSESFARVCSKAGDTSQEDRRVFRRYRDTYQAPHSALRCFADPLSILNFYNREILWELKALRVSGDFNHWYTTEHEHFSAFVNAILARYDECGLLVRNKDGELALDYEDPKWRAETLAMIRDAEFVQAFHKNNVAAATRHLRNDWGILRESGIGALYGDRWVVDPMFDSEIFSVFDLYVRYQGEYPGETAKPGVFFRHLFDALATGHVGDSGLTRAITDWLPCRVFVCEEHLKNWVAKKFFAESRLLRPEWRTETYFMLGMGLLDGKTMSASSGHAILAKDLITRYGSTKARLIILLAGGHPSKAFSYDESLPRQADLLLDGFVGFYTLLACRAHQEIKTTGRSGSGELLDSIFADVDRNLDGRYYRQAVIDLLSLGPQRLDLPEPGIASSLQFAYKKYLDIFLPGYIDDLNFSFQQGTRPVVSPGGP